MDSTSDMEKIRSKRLEKLRGHNQRNSDQTPETHLSPIPPLSTHSSSTANASLPETTKRDATVSSTAGSTELETKETRPVLDRSSTPTESQVTPRISISSKAASSQRTAASSASRSGSKQQGYDNVENWEDKTLGGIFKITLNDGSEQGNTGKPLNYLPGVVADLKDEGSPIRLHTGILDQVIVEVVSSFSEEKPLQYLLGCWKRVSRLYRAMRVPGGDDSRYKIVKEARRLCMSYCIFAMTIPEMFGNDINEEDTLAEHLLADPDSDSGICHDFLSEAIARFQDDETIRDKLVESMEQLSQNLAKMSMNEDYKPYVRAFRNFTQYPPLIDALTQSIRFLPSDVEAQDIETKSLLGPFFRLSPLQGSVASNYFSNPRTKDRAYIVNSQKALRMTLSTHQDELYGIVNAIVKSSKPSREKLLNWLAYTLNKNHKRRAMQADPKTTSSDGFMVNVTVCLDRLCEPFMDATFSKVDKIDPTYLRKSPRIEIEDETKINADQNTAHCFYANKIEGPSNFISEIFFLSVAAHHYGSEAAGSKLVQLQRDLKFMEKRLEEIENERQKFIHNPMQLSMFENTLKKYKDQIDRGYCVVHATQGVLLDHITQARSMQFMRYVIVWLLRLILPSSSYPNGSIILPLPAEQPKTFSCLPEYFIEDIVDNFKFITRNTPDIITSTQCEEIVTICIVFLRSTYYIKNPHLKCGLVTILSHGVWPLWNRPKGVLGDLLQSMPLALEHLLHALMNFYIEAENTGTHTQFYDKFNIRYEIFQIIKCIWSNPVYRVHLATEAKVNLDFFVRFVNLLLNDVTYVLDESFDSFNKIHDLQKQLNSPDAAQMDPTVKQEKEDALSAAQGKAKGYMNLTNETVDMLKLFTEALADSFTMPEIVQRLADMLDYNLDAMAGPKRLNLKIDNPQEYGFNPKQLLSALVDVYLNLKDKESFQLAVARDGRSYKPENFENASTIMSRYALKSATDIDTWNKFAATIKAVKEIDDQEEEDLGEIPDEFLDPLMFSLMSDPVILPSSKISIDRATIRSHLLSDPNDPFNREPLKIDQVIPNNELKEQIENFKAEKKMQKQSARMAVENMDTS